MSSSPSKNPFLMLAFLLAPFLKSKGILHSNYQSCQKLPCYFFYRQGCRFICLAMEKDELMKKIHQKEEELDREKLLRQIRLKENELQRLLSGIPDDQEFVVPGAGVWKIQSQKLDGKSIPRSEWVRPQMSPDFRYNCISINVFY